MIETINLLFDSLGITQTIGYILILLSAIALLAGIIIITQGYRGKSKWVG